MKKHFRNLMEYNSWANERLFYAMEDHDVEDRRMLDILGHIISTQIIWLLRIKGLPTSPFPLWESYNKVEIHSMLEESSRNWTNYMNEHKMDTFEEMIFYTDTKGKKRESTIRQIISQVLIHSSHHRGQLCLMLRDLGFDPPSLDYIAFSRLK